MTKTSEFEVDQRLRKLYNLLLYCWWSKFHSNGLVKLLSTLYHAGQVAVAAHSFNILSYVKSVSWAVKCPCITISLSLKFLTQSHMSWFQNNPVDFSLVFSICSESPVYHTKFTRAADKMECQWRWSLWRVLDRHYLLGQ